MKVLLYGESLQPGSGVWAYHETLKELGHQVTHHDSWEGLKFYFTHPAARLWWRVSRRILESHRKAHFVKLIERADRERPDVVIVLKGMNVGRDEVRALKQTGAWVVIINHDDFFSLNRANVSRAQRAALPEWDFVFVCREINVEEVAPFNPHVEFFQFAYYPPIHRPVPRASADEQRFVSDVVFVGTWERERARLMEQLVRRANIDLAVWGGQWGKLAPWSPLRNCVRGSEIYLDDQCRAIGGAKISLGFLRKKNRDKSTMRTFEIPACGGVLLAERTSLHAKIYREGVEAEFFDAADPEELAAKVRLLLADEQRRESMRLAGIEALKRGKHTYRDRLERLFVLHEGAVLRRRNEGPTGG